MNEKRLDLNCMVGSWPFYKARQASFPQLRRAHEKNGISGGMVSSVQALFYNDPYEADAELGKEIIGWERYRQVVTVNPLLPGWMEDLDRAAAELRPAGVRIAPGLHGYALKEAHALAEELERRNLPLYLTMHLEDERLAYLLTPKYIPLGDVRAFLLAHPDLQMLLCNLHYHEAGELMEEILGRRWVYFDTSGMKDPLFPMKSLEKMGLLPRLVYGSLSPLLCMESTILLVECSQLPQQTKNAIFAGRDWPAK